MTFLRTNDYVSIDGLSDDSNDNGTMCGGEDSPMDGEPSHYEPIGGGKDGPTNVLSLCPNGYGSIDGLNDDSNDYGTTCGCRDSPIGGEPSCYEPMGGGKDAPTNDLSPYPNDYGSIDGLSDDSNDNGTISGGVDSPIDGEPNHYEPIGSGKDGPTNDLSLCPNGYGSIDGLNDDPNDYGTICGGKDGPIDGEPNYHEPMGGGKDAPTNDLSRYPNDYGSMDGLSDDSNDNGTICGGEDSPIDGEPNYHEPIGDDKDGPTSDLSF